MIGSPRIIGALVAAVVFALAAVDASAQVDSRFVISGEVARRMGEMNMINGGTAEAISNACERLAAEHGESVTVVILDNFGNLVHLHRMDGNTYTATHTAEMKAQTAMTIRAPSRQRENNLNRNPNLSIREYALGYFPIAGGLPIWAGSQIIGFIGVGDTPPRPPEWSDEGCAHQAMEEVIGSQPPLPEVP